MRIGGIASGMDTETIIKDLMKAERVRVDRLFRQEESLKWKRDALNTTNKTLADFILKARSGFGLSLTTGTGTFDWVKQVSVSNESAIKATATANAMSGSHTIEVTQLADVARVTSNDISKLLTSGKFNDQGSFTIETANGTAKINITDAEYEGQVIDTANLDFSGDNTLVLVVNGKSVELNQKFDTVADLESHLSSFKDELSEIGITLSFEGDKLTFTSKNNIVINSSDNTRLGSLGLANETYKANNTISNIVNQINNSTDESGKSLGLRAAYDSKLGKLMITSKDQGDGQHIKVSQNTLTEGIFGATSDVFTNGVKGKNAIIKFNGEQVSEDAITSNNFSMYGINFQLKSANEGDVITVNVDTNTDGIMDKVKSFVEDYNTLIDNLNGLLKQKVYRDFQPLTKEEKEAMKDREIELWEEKAKSGLLRSDESLTKMMQTMREGLYKKVDGLDGFKFLIDIGITTGDYRNGGKLEINEDKLRAAINENPEGVIDLLFKPSDIRVPTLGKNPTSAEIQARNTALANKRANSGLVERLFDDMITGMKDIVRRSGTGDDASLFRSVQSNMLVDFVTSGSKSLLDKDLTSIGSRIANEERILASRESRYWSQFTAMEKALQKMNSQSSWLASQLGQA